MKLRLVCGILVAAGLLFGTSQVGFAAARGPQAQGGRGDAHGQNGRGGSQGGRHEGFRGSTVAPQRQVSHDGFRGAPVANQGFRGAPVAPQPQFTHNHSRGHSVVAARVFIDPAIGWGPSWWEPTYAYGAPSYYGAPPVVVPEAPPAYIQQEPPPEQPSY